MKTTAARCLEEAASSEARETLAAPDGGRVERVGDALELRDPEGRLLVRYRDGALELSPARGDLVLSAPQGRVRIDAALDVAIEAGRDVALRGARAVELGVAGAEDDPLRTRLSLQGGAAKLASRALELRARKLGAIAASCELVATAMRASATNLEARAETIEASARDLKTRAISLVSEVAELWETRAGRARTTVTGRYELETKRTTLRSEDDTSIDGKRVLLG